MPDTSNFLAVDRQGPIFRIVMQRIAKKNALNTALYSDLTTAFQTADADRNTRVILLTAAGGTFTSGNDLDDFSKFRTSGKPRPGTAFISVIARVQKPIVAAVNGPAIGIGSTMLLHCDLVYASESASFQMPFVNLGLCPEAGSTYLLPRMLGHQRASELLLLGGPISAKEAAAIGMINRVYPDDRLAAGAAAAARKIASQPPEAIRAAKALLKASGRRGLDAAIAREGRRFDERLASSEFEAGYTAFKARSTGYRKESAMAFDNLTLEKTDHIATITIDHPPANTWNLATMQAFEKAIDAVENDDQVRAVILTGAGEKCFSAGFDVRDAANAATISPKGRELWRRIDRFAKPVIAAINGYAMGGGLELALACHFRIMADAPHVQVGLTELNLGILPGWGGTQRLPRLVGRSKALDMILFSRRLNAQQALEAGLADQVVPPEALSAKALELAQQLAERPPIAVRCVLKAMTAGLYEGMDAGLQVEAEGSALVRETEDREEGFRAFLEKRKPRFKGR